MRAASKRAYDTIQLLEDKLALTKIQLRDAANRLEKIQQGAVPAGAHCAALDGLEQENEHLRESLQTERNDKAEMQGKLDKLDSENLNLSIEYDSIDAELIQSKKSRSTLRDSMEAVMYELNMLRKVVQGQQGVLGEQDQSELLILVSRTTEENRSLVESVAKMEAKVQEIEQYGATIEDKSESEVMKAKDMSDYWWHLYHNEAVPTTERLHAEIAALKQRRVSSTLSSQLHL
jgi:chromosome segregation ATPase